MESAARHAVVATLGGRRNSSKMLRSASVEMIAISQTIVSELKRLLVELDGVCVEEVDADNSAAVHGAGRGRRVLVGFGVHTLILEFADRLAREITMQAESDDPACSKPDGGVALLRFVHRLTNGISLRAICGNGESVASSPVLLGACAEVTLPCEAETESKTLKTSMGPASVTVVTMKEDTASAESVRAAR